MMTRHRGCDQHDVPELDPRWRRPARYGDGALHPSAIEVRRRVYDDAALFARGPDVAIGPAFDHLVTAVRFFTGSQRRTEGAVESLRRRLHRTVDRHADAALARVRAESGSWTGGGAW